MKIIKTPVPRPFNAPNLGIEDDKTSQNYGWLCVQSELIGEWRLLADLKPYGDLFQPTLLGWSAAQWESAGTPPVPIPACTEQAVYLIKRWRRDAAPPGKTDPAVMSTLMFERFRQLAERDGTLTGGPKG